MVLIIIYNYTVRHLDAFNIVGDIKKSFQENNGCIHQIRIRVALG